MKCLIGNQMCSLLARFTAVSNILQTDLDPHSQPFTAHGSGFLF